MRIRVALVVLAMAVGVLGAARVTGVAAAQAPETASVKCFGRRIHRSERARYSEETYYVQDGKLGGGVGAARSHRSSSRYRAAGVCHARFEDDSVHVHTGRLRRTGKASLTSDG